MANINGGTIGEGALGFLGGSVYVPGGTANPGSEPMIINGGQTVVGEDVIVSCSNLGNHSGNLTLENSSLDINPSGNLNGIKGFWVMNNVDIYSQVSDYVAIGNWTPGSATYNWDNVNFICNVDNTQALGFMSPFFFTVNTVTGLNNISFWNGNTLASTLAGGAVLQTTSDLIWDSPTFGPFGLRLNTSNLSGRALLRTSGSDNAGAINSTQGYIINDDRTSWGEINDATHIATISIDTGANTMFINTLPGVPTSSASFTYANVVGNTASNARVRNATVTNPVCDDNSVKYTIPSSLVASAFAVPTTLPLSSDFNAQATTFSTQTLANPANGFGFINQVKQFTSGATVTGEESNYGIITDADSPNSVAIAQIPTHSYRQYSWLQQPSNTLFGRELQVAPPVNNATAAQVATARANGYSIINVGPTGAVTWGDEYDVNTAVDPYIALTGFTAVGVATAAYDGAPVNRSGVHVIGQMKEVAMTTNPDANNTKIDLPYEVIGTAVDFGSRTVTIGSDQSRAYNTTTASIDASAITPDDLITEVEAATITLTGIGWEDSTDKIGLVATSSINLGGVSVVSGSFHAPVVNCDGAGVISDSDFVTSSIVTLQSSTKLGANNTYTARSSSNLMSCFWTGGLTLGQTYTAEELLGEGYTIADGDQLDLNTNVQINVATSDPQITGGANVTLVTPTIVSTYTNVGNAAGGNFALFSRTSGSAPWTQVGSTLRNSTSAILEITVDNAALEYLSLWKPRTTDTYTQATYYNHSSTQAPTQSLPYRAATREIPAEILSTAGVPTGSSVWTDIVNWAAGSGDTAGQLVGTFRATNEVVLGNGETQVAFRQAFLTDAYFDIIVADVQTASPKLLPSTLIADEAGRADYITVLTKLTTRANGDFVELLSFDGKQQNITAVENSSDTPMSGILSAVLMGETAGGDEIEFDAVDIADNPAGISEAEVVSAVSAALGVVKANQQVLLTATQRGSVKAATYTAGNITT